MVMLSRMNVRSLVLLTVGFCMVLLSTPVQGDSPNVMSDVTFYLPHKDHLSHRKLITDRSDDLVVPFKTAESYCSGPRTKDTKECECAYSFYMVYNNDRHPKLTLEARCMDDVPASYRNLPFRPSNPMCVEDFYVRWVRVKKIRRDGSTRWVRRLLKTPMSCIYVEKPVGKTQRSTLTVFNR